MVNHPTQDLRYHILLVSIKNDVLQYSNLIQSRKLSRITQTAIELKFERAVKNFVRSLQPIPTSTQSEHRTFFIPFVVTSFLIYFH